MKKSPLLLLLVVVLCFPIGVIMALTKNYR